MAPTATGPARGRTRRAVGGQAYSYDANGNLESGGGRTCAWNADNQPVSITSEGVQETHGYSCAH